MGGEPIADHPMFVRITAIPEQDDGAAHVAREMSQKRRTCGPRMLIRAYSASANVNCRCWGDTMRAPIPDTFSCEHPRTATVGVVPRGAQVRRSTGIIMKPVSSRQIR